MTAVDGGCGVTPPAPYRAARVTGCMVCGNRYGTPSSVWRIATYGDLMEVMNLLRNAGYLKVALVGLDGRT